MTGSLPNVKIERYDEPETKSVLAVEVWEVFVFPERRSWGHRICVHHDESTGLPFVSGFKEHSSAECFTADEPVEVVGRLVLDPEG